MTYLDSKNVFRNSGLTSLNGARPLNSNGAPTKYKKFTVSNKQKRTKKRSPLFFGFSYRLFPTTEH